MSRLTRWLRSFARPSEDEKRILQVLEGLDVEGIRRRYAGSPRLKYLDFPRFIRRDVAILRRLGLDKSPPLRILDIGCGAGQLMYVMKHYGHRPVGIDIEDPFYAEMAALYGVERRIEAVMPFKPLEIEGPFDLITATAITFDRLRDERSRREGTWGAREWLFFFNDIERLLAPSGRVYLKLNKSGNDVRPHEAFAAGTSERGGRSLLYDRAGLAHTIRALTRETGMKSPPPPRAASAYGAPLTP